MPTSISWATPCKVADVDLIYVAPFEVLFILKISSLLFVILILFLGGSLLLPSGCSVEMNLFCFALLNFFFNTHESVRFAIGAFIQHLFIKFLF